MYVYIGDQQVAVSAGRRVQRHSQAPGPRALPQLHPHPPPPGMPHTTYIIHISYIYIHICLIPKCIMHTGVPERRRQGAGAVRAIARAGLGARELVHAPLLLAHQVSFLALSVLYIVHARRGPIVCLCLCLCLLCVCMWVCMSVSV